MDALRSPALLIGRILLVGIFIWDATVIIRFYPGTVSYMESFGVPGFLAPLVILLQLGGGLLIVVGWWTRLIALAFAGFSLATALMFHHDFANADEVIQFGKDMALCGGFLLLFVTGPGRWSRDGDDDL